MRYAKQILLQIQPIKENTHIFLFTTVLILQIMVHDTLESLYKHVDKSVLPVEYLPDDYTGPNSGSISQIIGRPNSYFVCQ